MKSLGGHELILVMSQRSALLRSLAKSNRWWLEPYTECLNQFKAFFERLKVECLFCLVAKVEATIRTGHVHMSISCMVGGNTEVRQWMELKGRGSKLKLPMHVFCWFCGNPKVDHLAREFG